MARFMASIAVCMSGPSGCDLPSDVGQDARPIHSSSVQADSRLIASKNVASATRRGYARNGQLTAFSTVSILGSNGSASKRDLPGVDLGDPISYSHYFS